MSKKALEGVRVLDLTQAYSGPFCTMHLADNGAEVIKIERPGIGDQSRQWGPFKKDCSAYYAYINRNKKGISLDINTPEGAEIFKKMVKEADVVCENFKVGTMEKMGLGYEELKKVNPQLIYASISGFGRTSSYAKRPCYDIVAAGFSGIMSFTGMPDGPQLKPGPSIADNYSGTYLSLGITMALYQKAMTGEGQRLDVSMVDTMFSVLESAVVMYTVDGTIATKAGNRDVGLTPFDSFKAKDGEYVMACGSNKMFAGLCKLMGREDVLEDPRYASNRVRCEHPDEVKAIIEEWSMQRTVAEVEALLVEAGMPCGPILNMQQVVEHPVIAERNMLWEVYQPAMEQSIKIPGCPIKMDGQVDAPTKCAPEIGEDNLDVYSTMLGLKEEDLKALEEKGVI
ncbi:CoA transferase [Chakrabartyella piscis]|uniref:CaiB/BaiF CoA transferase family protein n=1 Tax=Chakrabartyella piscis TaxID=2918914 RepID=UPI002958D9FA|nr:CoA transferase [Chakrabartyella piscis]